MVKIRLTRIGKRQSPFYRIVVVDARVAPQKKYLELLGTYNPFNKDLKLDVEKTCNWIKKGAQPTDSARRLLTIAGVMKKLHEAKTNPES